MRCNIKKISAIMLFGAIALVGFGYAFMMLWNWLVPTLFQGPEITYWQGVGLLVLFKILFGHHGRGCGKCCGHQGTWKNRWKEKFMNMNQEEKEAFKNKLKSKFGCSNTQHEENCYPPKEIQE